MLNGLSSNAAVAAGMGSEPIFGTGPETLARHIVSGRQAKRIRIQFRLTVLKHVIRYFGLTPKAYRVLAELTRKQKLIHGEGVFSKWVRAGGKFFYTQYSPGFPSVQMDQVLVEEIRRIAPVNENARPLRMAFFAITKKCPLQCEHCFEWDNINKKELLSLQDLRTVVGRLLDAGITQLHLSGGEPMLRIHDILELAREFTGRVEIWVLTSGFNCSEQNIAELKRAGITGMVVSVDHHDREMHDAFRRHEGSYDNALAAIRHARRNGMPVAVSICATKEFCTSENLASYLELMRRQDVSFIQLLEPRAVGRYAGRNVELEEKQVKLLTSFYDEVNFSKAYDGYPLVVYHGYYQRRAGCFSAGNRSMYVDTNGGVTACPFCQHVAGNLLQEPVDHVIGRLREKGCSSFGSSRL